MEEQKPENSFKEDRVRKIAMAYYARPDVRKNMLEFAKNRECVPRYFEGFGKRPDTFQFESEVFELAKKGATSFHCSEEIWSEPLELATGMTPEQLNKLRQGWDLLIDIDSKYLDYSKIAAELLIRALEYNGVKSIGIKFSGSKGFHLIVPWNSFPEEVFGKKTKDMFPEWPRLICQYLNSMIKKELIEKITNLMMKDRKAYVHDFEAPEKVMPDLVLVSSRHLFRMPYSLHEKTALASVVIAKEKVKDFEITDADAMKAKPINFIPDSRHGEATELLVQALDCKPKQPSAQINQQNKPNFNSNAENKGFSEIIIKDLSPELYPPSIKTILAGMKTDGRKRGLFILLNFFKSLKMDPEKIKKTIEDWDKLNYQPLGPGYVNAQLSWHLKQKESRLPPNFDKPHYKEIGIQPTPEEIRAKNPVSYVIRKNFRKSKNSRFKP